MVRMNRKKVMGALLISMGTWPTIGQGNVYTGQIVDSAQIELKDGDQVTNTDMGFTIKDTDVSSPGIQLGVGEKIDVDLSLSATPGTSNQATVIYLKNGKENHLGTGTTITYSDVDTRILNTSAIGLYLDGSGVKANALEIDVSALGRHAVGIRADNAGAKIDLGAGSTIKAKSTGGFSQGISLTMGAEFSATGLRLTSEVEGTDPARSTPLSATGITMSGSAIANLGTNSVITVTGKTAGEGAYGLSIYDNSKVIADHLTLTVTSPLEARAIGVSILSTAASAKTGSTIDFGLGSIVTAKGYAIKGLSAGGTNSKIIGDSLQVSAEGERSTGVQVDDYGTIDLGVGSQVAVKGNLATGINVYSTNNALFKGKELTVYGDGPNLSGFVVNYQGANAQVDGGSIELTGTNGQGVRGYRESLTRLENVDITITGNSGKGIVAETDATINFIGGDMNIIGSDSYGVKASGAISTKTATNIENSIITMDGLYNYGAFMESYGGGAGAISLKNSEIKMLKDSSYGLFSTGAGATIKASDVAILLTKQSSDGIQAKAGGVVEISDRLIVKYDGAVGTAINSIGNGSKVQGTSRMYVLGNMKASDSGVVDLTMTDGSVFIGTAQQTDGKVTLNMLSGSKWYATGNNDLDHRLEDGSFLYLGAPPVANANYFIPTTVRNAGTFTVNGGTTWFQADVGAITGDRLVLTNEILGTQGKVGVENFGASVTDGTEKLVLIEAKQGGAGFTLSNQVEQGGYIYKLGNEFDGAVGTNWFLYGTKEATSTGSASINSFGAGYLLGYAETQTLLQRMGDLRQSEVTGEPTGNIWARGFGGKFTSSSDGFLSGFDMTYSGLQIGADKKRKWGNADVYLGAMFGFSHANQDFETGSGSISDRHIGLYGVYIQPSGFYVDSLVKYTKMDHDFKVLDTAGTRVTGDDMSTDGLSASIEIGQRIHFDRTKKEGWYLEPQAQISTGHQSGGSFNASNGLRVDVDSYNSTLGRLGLNAGYEIKSGKNPVNIYAKASYVHEFDGDVAYRFNGSREQTSFGDSWWTYGLGITAQINKKHNVYLDVERASGGQFNQPWSVNGGYRFNW